MDRFSIAKGDTPPPEPQPAPDPPQANKTKNTYAPPGVYVTEISLGQGLGHPGRVGGSSLSITSTPTNQNPLFEEMTRSQQITRVIDASIGDQTWELRDREIEETRRLERTYEALERRQQAFLADSPLSNPATDNGPSNEGTRRVRARGEPEVTENAAEIPAEFSNNGLLRSQSRRSLRILVNEEHNSFYHFYEDDFVEITPQYLTVSNVDTRGDRLIVSFQVTRDQLDRLLPGILQ